MSKHNKQSPEHSGAGNTPFYENIMNKKRRSKPHSTPRTASTPRAERTTRDGRTPRTGSASSAERMTRNERAPRPFTPPAQCPPVFCDSSKDTENLLARFFDLSLDVLPLDSRKLQQLPNDIRDLSHELTDERSERRKGYMNNPVTLSAYIRYYQWWNLVRLVKLFSVLPVNLKAGDVLADLGSGPLTLPIALWMARPDLRSLPLTWYCVDLSAGALSAGEELFLKIAAETGQEPWNIVRVKGGMGVSLRKKVSFVASANMFNEMYLDDSLSVYDFAESQARDLASYALPDASILVVEPGIPRAANFVSLVRRALMNIGYNPISPCPHEQRCPFPGERGKKWCHFVFDTASAPEGLKKLSEQAGLAKDRAALSFVFSRGAETVRSDDEEKEEATTDALGMLSRMNDLYPPLRIRIISDPIRLPGYRTGRYGCSDMGMILVSGSYDAAKYLEKCVSGSCLELPRPNLKELDRDPKSGAILIELDRQKRSSRQDSPERQERPARQESPARRGRPDRPKRR